MGKKNLKQSKHNVTESMKLNELVNKLFKDCTSFINEGFYSTSCPTYEHFSRIYQTLHEIIISEKSNKNTSRCDDKTLKTFYTWLNKNDVILDGIAMKNFNDEGFGLCAKRNIKKNDLVLQVPKKIMITEETARQSAIGEFLQKNPILEKMNNVSLALYVLYELNKTESFWSPYLQFLPQQFNTCFYFTIDQFNALRGSTLYEESLKMYVNIARQYSYLYRIINNMPKEQSISQLKRNFTFHNYRWAVSVVMTRVNKIPSSNATEEILALVPAWDLANHEHGILSTDFDDESSSIKCFAHRDFASSEQFKIFYGPRSNFEFFLHSGFVLKDNAYDSVTMRLGVSKNDALHKGKTKLLSTLSLQSPALYKIVPGKHPISNELLCFARIFSMDKDSLDYWCKSENKASDLMHLDCDVGTLIQDKAVDFLYTRINLFIKVFDAKVLPTESENEIDRAICSVINEERKLLKNALTYLQTMLKN